MLSSATADIYVLDLRIPEGDGVETIKALLAREPGTKVLVFTTHDNEEDVFQALEAGAHGYLLKDTTKDEPVNAVRLILQGELYPPHNIAARLAHRLIRP